MADLVAAAVASAVAELVALVVTAVGDRAELVVVATWRICTLRSQIGS